MREDVDARPDDPGHRPEHTGPALPLRWLERVEAFLCVALTVAIIASIGLQVIFRYVLHAPLIWSDEFARYCVVWLTFMGAALAAARGGHIAIELGDGWLGKAGVRAISILAALMVVAACALVVISSDGPIAQAARRSSTALGVPLWVLTVAAPVGFGLIGLHYLVTAWALLRNRRSDSHPEVPRGMI